MKKATNTAVRRYTDGTLNHVVFPLGGMGAGMIGLEGTGAFSQVSLRHKADVMNEPLMFAALHVKGVSPARVLEGPVPMRKIFGVPGAGGGSGRHHYGLPRFARAEFTARFPFATVGLSDPAMPVTAELTGWSPFAPPDPDTASLPVAGLEYRFVNRTAKPLKAVFSFHARNFMKPDPQTAGRVSPLDDGFLLEVPENATPPHVASWQISKRFPKTAPVTEAPCVKLSDPLEWEPADMFNNIANAHKRYGSQDGLVYIGTRLRVARAGSWIFSIGHDGGMRMFVDGKPAGAEGRRENPHRPERTRIPVSLEPGDHEVVFAFDLAGGGGWGVSLTFRQPEGEPVQEKPVYPEPEAWTPRPPSVSGWFAASTSESPARVDCAWFRGGWFDPLTMLWKTVESGGTPAKPPHDGAPGDGASFYVPFSIPARGEKTLRVRLAWYVPRSGMVAGGASADCDCGGACGPSAYVPWYASRFAGIAEVGAFWRDRYDGLREETKRFSDCFYDTTLPAEAVEAAAANLSILKSPTVLRQHDGRLWGWEGCTDTGGCCEGSCTHVWNYAQALPHLFPSLERGLRETEFVASQDARGHQNFRSALPIRPTSHGFHAAADGQLGGIIKLYREWRIGGDTVWMKGLWPRVRQSLDYCIGAWDPDHTGTVVEPHHNTYDIEFWGADGMCTSFYLGALQAAVALGRAAGDDTALFETLLARGRKAMETSLWNGAYFTQKIQWKGLRAADPTKMLSVTTSYSPEALAILEKEGPKYQYGTGCLSDGVLGDWLARVSGLAPVLDPAKVRKHMRSVYRHNFRKSLADHANPQRPGYALGAEGGLLLCSWPKGGKPSLPFVYSDEVWTGIEYQAAAHLILLGAVEEGLEIVRTLRKRYDGQFRNPFDEYECGHWYARAMASYSLLPALSGARYDAVEKTLYLNPAVAGDFTAFLSAAGGYGTVGLKRDKPFLKVVSGCIAVDRIVYTPPKG